jgi:hypothetical protein
MLLQHKTLLRIAICAFALLGLYHILSAKPWQKLYNILSISHPSRRVLENLSMTEGQCRVTFPGLMKEIDDAVARGAFELERAKDDYTGLVQGRIEDGKVSLYSADWKEEQLIHVWW